MKILELCLSPDLGGLELYVLRSARALSAQDEVLTLCHPHGRLQEKLAAEGLAWQGFDNGWTPLPLLAARRLARLYDSHAIEVVHIHWGKDLPLAALAKQLSHCKPALVYTRQMQLTRAKRDFYHRFLYGQMDKMLTITEVLAQAARRNLPAEDAGKVGCLYYGVAKATPLAAEERTALRQEWGVPENAMLVGLFGRMEPYKGQTFLLQALATAKRNGESIHALLVGHEMEQGYRQQLQALCEELGIADRVTFRDFVDNPQRWMQACDVLALTTIEETFGLVLVEAMLCGVAVIGSDRGGVPEIITHGKTGLLFRSTDVADLHAQLQRLYREPEERQTLAEAGRAEAEQRFDEGHHYQSLRAIFSSLVDTAAGGA